MKSMLVRTFSDDATPADGGGDKSEGPEYSFEGYNVEFSTKVMLTSLVPNRSALATGQSVSYQFALDPDREGTFIIPDIYPEDLHGNPAFDVLPGLTINGKEVVGCVVKASEGVGWGKKNEDWFKNSWKKVRDIAGSRYGVDFFRGSYHFLLFSVDGAKQADYFCDLVDAAGGWGDGDLMPWVDIEEGGQGSWAPQRLETITDSTLRRRLADDVTTCATAFVKRFKERTGLRIAVYGRGVFRDLQMTDGKFGADSVVNPAYTQTMPQMDRYGVPLDDITLWQLCGVDSKGKADVFVPGFPAELTGWGKTDYSVYIDGARKTSLKTLRDRCLARPR
jgi:GH25 family lysozyme M1 (1,4-beta-N-acetylmuramidase)